jgi:DNA-binding PucR family transcriptional regulator
MTVLSQDVTPQVPDLSRDVDDLIRQVATTALDPVHGLLAEVQAASLSPIQARFGDLPSLVEETAAATRQNVTHWLRSIQASPLTPVDPLLAPSVLGVAHSLNQRGAIQDHWAAYSAGREALWRAWMRIAFGVATDHETLNDALAVASTSLSRWIDDTIFQVGDYLTRTAGHQGGASHELKFQTAIQILDGAALDEELAAYRLKYSLAGEHIAAIVWTDPASPNQPALRQVATQLTTELGQRSLSVLATSSSAWVWLATTEVISDLAPVLAAFPEVRLALGSVGAGIEGFRRSHYEAIDTQRLMLRRDDVQCASFDEVSLAALASRDEQAAREFIARVLGRLGTADLELRETVRVFIRRMGNGSKTAEEVYAHRNTVSHRIQRAEALLPHPLSTNGVEVAMALELQRWLP